MPGYHFELAAGPINDKRGFVHIIFDRPFTAKGIKRDAGDILCEPFRQRALVNLVQADASQWHTRRCAKCQTYAERYGVELPPTPKLPDDTVMTTLMVTAPAHTDRPYVEREADPAGSYMDEEVFRIHLPEQFLDNYLQHYKSQHWFAFTASQWAGLVELGLAVEF